MTDNITPANTRTTYPMGAIAGRGKSRAARWMLAAALTSGRTLTITDLKNPQHSDDLDGGTA
ncbi:hypothetical protein [Streptosporangium saharense]|uniref:Uncharacterized protein n=1 Tax=Streptosporangium saharense TaxID=1706840 RepID=A0A7W7VP02_9ACTN|nr:hypothetical protein [Streptosporangium saharense]MBB4917412.1 hypothetical protein [Streptosporangium saharense]